jgi:outer membrane translocation and assembly module TamA
MSAEYRWTPNRAGLDAAIFIDSGKVASSRSDLDFEGLKTSIGFGLRLHTPAATPLRIEIARSNEGLRLIFGTSAAF